MDSGVQEIVIRAGQTDARYWRDLWSCRELLWFLAWRDVLVRYKQTVIGIAWALIRPFLTMIVFTILFSVVARMPSEGDARYLILMFAGLLPWFFFTAAFSQIFTPLGFMPQQHLDGKDAWGLDGGEWQEHRSGWCRRKSPGLRVMRRA